MTPSLAQVHRAFGQWLELPPVDQGPPHESVDMALATVVANRMDGDPLWLFLVAPPSGGKTEVIRALDEVPDVYPLSSLTAQTFASGFERKGTETSLLPKIDGKTVTMKDFGTVLTMYHEKRAEILAQLREIYDGGFTKEFGNGKTFRWSGKLGLLAGVTPIIDREYALNQVLGERFLLYRVKSAPARALARRAMAQRQREGDQRRMLRQLMAGFLDTVSLVPPPLSEPMLDAIAALAEFTALARSPVLLDQRGEINYIPAPEGPGRLAKQLVLLAQALAAVRGEPALELTSYLTVYQVAQDTLPAQRRVMLEVLLAPERAELPTTTIVAEATRYPTSTARRYLQELAAIRLVDRLTDGPGHSDRWQPSGLLLGLLDAMKAPMAQTYLPSQVRESVVSE
jgi:hypothetical protein